MEYYKRYLDYQYLRIKEKTEKLNQSEGEKRKRVLLSLTGYEVDLLKAEFSSGASREKLTTLLAHSMDIVSENSNITRDDLLTFLCLAVMLDMEKDAKKLIKENKNTVENDRLLSFISEYIEKGTATWEESKPLAKEYKLLDYVFLDDDRIMALNKYLAKWYELRAEYAWFDAHLRDTDTYCGYWSFESAAIVKILNLDSSKLDDSVYYPVL